MPFETLHKADATFTKKRGLTVKKTAAWSEVSEATANEILKERYGSANVEFMLRQARSGHPVDTGWGWLRYENNHAQEKP